MKKIQTTQEINQVIDNQVGELINKVTCQIFIKGKKNDYDPLGTGIFIKLETNYYLITAAHVAEHKEEGIYIFTSNGGDPLKLFGHLEMTNYKHQLKIDVAYIKLDNDIIPFLESDFRFLTKEYLWLSHELVDADQYLAFGYPARNVSIKEDFILTKAAYFQIKPAKDIVYSYYKFEKKLFYTLEFKGKGINMRSNEKSHKFGSQKGISGGGLWIIIIDKIDGEFIVNFKLIGIMTDERNGKYHCLIANKVDAVIGGIANLDTNREAQKLIDEIPNKTVIYKHKRAK